MVIACCTILRCVFLIVSLLLFTVLALEAFGSFCLGIFRIFTLAFHQVRLGFRAIERNFGRSGMGLGL